MRNGRRILLGAAAIVLVVLVGITVIAGFAWRVAKHPEDAAAAGAAVMTKWTGNAGETGESGYPGAGAGNGAAGMTGSLPGAGSGSPGDAEDGVAAGKAGSPGYAVESGDAGETGEAGNPGDAGKTEQNVPTAPETSMLLVALGDSIALGIGDEEDGGFVERLRGSLETLQGEQVRVVNLAVNGLRSDQLLDSLTRKDDVRTAVAEAGMIAVSIGGNDLARVIKKHALELSMERFEDGRTLFADHLAEIVDMLSNGNESADIYLLGLFNPLSAWFSDIPELADIFDGWNRTIRETAEAYDRVYYVPVDDLFAEGGPEYTADDFVHPNGAGHGLIAERTLEVIAAVTGEGEGGA